jgi:hypothetical protein
MSREGYVAIVNKWDSTAETMVCHIDRANTTRGLFTERGDRRNSMGVLDMPCIEIRFSRLVRDTQRQLRQWTDVMERRDRIDLAREAELSGELKDKWNAMLNRHNFYPVTRSK